MHNPLLTKGFTAEAAINPYRLLKFGTAAGQVIQAAAATDAIFGVAPDVSVAIGNPADAHVAGIAFVEYGGNVSRGDRLTSDANGKAVAAAPAAGVNNSIIGTAMKDGVDGDVGSVLITPSQIQG